MGRPESSGHKGQLYEGIIMEQWTLRKDEDDGCIIVGIEGDGGVFAPIARVVWYGEDDVNAEEDEATAHLIAAAPKTKQQRDDLLDACKDMDVALRKHPFVTANQANAWTKIKAAIAKAKE